MMEFPSSKLISHLWRFHPARGIYMAISYKLAFSLGFFFHK